MMHCRFFRGRLLGVLLLGASFLALRPLSADIGQPKENDARVAKTVSDFLQQHHLSGAAIDDTISRRTFWTFLTGSRAALGFDPTKSYFVQADIDEFRKHELTLDEEVAAGDLRFAYTVFERYLARMRERMSLIEKLIAAPHDFSIDEDMSTDYENMPFATNAAEIEERWRKKIKFDLLKERTEKKPLPEAQQREKVLKRYRNLLHRWEQTDSDELLEMYLNALTTSFDPHSNYMSPTTLEDFTISMRLHLDGIGARLRSEDGYTIVAEVVAGGAADKDGRLKVEDKIVGVAADGENVVDVVDMKLTDVVKKIRGPSGSQVVLRVQPAGKADTVDYKMTRAKIELKGQEAKGDIIEQGKKQDGSPYRVGYINLPSFYLDIAAANNGQENFKSCHKDVEKLIKQFQENGPGIDGLVIDLRENGGGVLSEAVDLTGLFIDKGAVVKVKGRRRDREEEHEDEHAGTAYSGPLMVLVSKFSASSSEIFAGAIQDYGRGLVVGDSSTHGKGTVQTVVDIGRQVSSFFGKPQQLGALKLTIQQFYRVNGESTQRHGVPSDIVLPSLVDNMDIAEGDLPQALPFHSVQASTYDRLPLVSSDLKAKLRELSDKRREQSADFAKLAEDITRWKEMKDRKAVSLNEDKRREERRRSEQAENALADPDDPENPGEQKKEKPVFDRTFYNNEVLSIMEDFLRLAPHRPVAKKI
jgi:carboxyl-terminal processing protease